jgi:hypothetical protein
MALGCADRSTIAAPSEFGTWARLAQVYVAMEDWEHALAILNSCPMFTYQDKDTPIMPEPKDVYLPTLPETRLDEIDSEPDSRYGEQVDPSLLNLRAAQYKGTFRQAYNLLTEMTAKIGWDQLLKIRSNVFVMEDEYRSEKQEQHQQHHPQQQLPTDAPGQRNPSTDAIRENMDTETNGEKSGDEDDDAESKRSEVQPDLELPRTNGETKDNALEKPLSTITPDVVKSDKDKVRSITQSYTWITGG